jgi:hypothetical protein
MLNKNMNGVFKVRRKKNALFGLLIVVAFAGSLFMHTTSTSAAEKTFNSIPKSLRGSFGGQMVIKAKSVTRIDEYGQYKMKLVKKRDYIDGDGIVFYKKVLLTKPKKGTYQAGFGGHVFTMRVIKKKVHHKTKKYLVYSEANGTFSAFYMLPKNSNHVTKELVLCGADWQSHSKRAKKLQNKYNKLTKQYFWE